MMIAKLGSSAADSASPLADSSVFSDDFDGGSSPSSAIPDATKSRLCLASFGVRVAGRVFGPVVALPLLFFPEIT
jgi:hypothetical protein